VIREQKGDYRIGSVSDLVNLIKRKHQSILKKRVRSVFIIGTAILLLGFLLITLLEYRFYISSWIKSSLLAATFFSSGASVFFILKNYTAPSFTSLYQEFADHSKLEPLKNAIDLYTFKRGENHPLRSAAINQNISALSNQKIQRKLTDYLVHRPEQKLYKKGLAGLTVSAGFLLCVSFLLSDAVNRSFHFWKNYQAPNPYSYTVNPGNITLEQGASLVPEITFSEEIPKEIKLAFKTDIEENFRTRPVSSLDQNTASFSPLTPNTDAAYYFIMDGFKSRVFEADIQLLPRFKSLKVIVNPPSYTELDSTVYSYPLSNIRAYRGSELTLTGKTNKPLKKLTLIKKQIEDRVSFSLTDGQNVLHQLDLTESDTLAFFMKDSVGLTNKNNFEFIVELLDDQNPFVQIVEPETNMEMEKPAEISIEYEANDDFGLTSAQLNYELKRAFRKEAVKGSVPLKIPALNNSETFPWDIKQLNPKPRDVLSFRIEVFDNDAINGSKKATSRTITINFPSLTAQLDKLDRDESNIEDKLEEVSDSYKEMKREYDHFKKQLREKPQGNWEQQQTLEQVREQHEKMDQKVQDLNKKFEEIRKDLEKSDLMSEETLKTYNELQKLLEDIDDPELAKALEELQKAMGNLNQQQLKEAIENFEFNEQQYQERLQRTMELFQKLKLNSDLDKLAKALEELSRKEKELAESDENSSEEIQKQQAIQKDTEELSKKIEELSEQSPDESKEEIDKLQKETEQQIEEVREKLQKNLENLQQSGGSGNSNTLKQQQQQIQKQFQQMAGNMRSSQQNLMQQQFQINITALQYILHSLINLSEKQEELAKETELLTNRSQAFVQKARTEDLIAGQFKQISDSLFQVSANLPAFSNRINERKNQVEKQLQTAVEQLSERNKSNSVYAERQSLGGINELSSMVASLLDQIQSQQSNGSGSGQMSMQDFIKKLQEMSGQQQMLNQQIQDFINDIQGERLTKDQMDRLNQLSRQQNRIRKQLRDLQNNGELESGDRVLSELERMSEQMEETINDLRGGETDENVIERQQNILSRMLNAEKALQERGKEEKREGTTAEDIQNTKNPDVTLEELQKRLRQFLNDPEQTQFTEDYQKLIELYFNLLREQQKDNLSGS